MDEKACILIVDDDENTRKSLALILTKKGYEVETTGTGNEALEKVKTRSINLVLLDIKLPDIEGIQLIAPLKMIQPDISVVMVTGFASVENAVHALNEGACGYITKPLNMDEMLAKVNDALDRQRLIMEKAQAEEALRESEERYRILAEAAHDAIFTLTPDGVATYINSDGAAIMDMSPEKIVGLPLESLFHPGIAKEFRKYLNKVISSKKPVRSDLKFKRLNQNQINWVDTQFVPQFGPDGSVVQVVGISRNITDRKQAEILLKRFNEELESQVHLRTAELERTTKSLEVEIIKRTLAEERIRKSLNERELLLREIHHRVKNNLQIVLSLISLQFRSIKDPHLLNIIGEFHNRIMAMALIHERMCRAEDISSIDLSEFVTFLGTNLFKFYNVNPQAIRLNVELKDLHLTINTAIPISLIANELISNSLTHAFPKGTTGEITIAGHRKADIIVLSIKDTGIGIPEDLDWKRSKQPLGLQLVVGLVKQLDGSIELEREKGTKFTIMFQEKKQEDSLSPTKKSNSADQSHSP